MMRGIERRGQNVTGEGRDVYGAVVTYRFFDVLCPRLRGCIAFTSFSIHYSLHQQEYCRNHDLCQFYSHIRATVILLLLYFPM